MAVFQRLVNLSEEVLMGIYPIEIIILPVKHVLMTVKQYQGGQTSESVIPFSTYISRISIF